MNQTTEQKLAKILAKEFHYHFTEADYHDPLMKDLMAWHTAELERTVREARINEVEWSLHHLGLTDKDRESIRLKNRRQELELKELRDSDE